MSAPGDGNAPLASAVLATDGGLERLTAVLESLRRQTVADRIEIMIVAGPGKVAAAECAAIPGFAAVRLVEVDFDGHRGLAAAAAVPEARSPYILLHENHMFGDPDMLEGLLAEMDEGAGGIGAIVPACKSANPDHLWGVTSFCFNHGPIVGLPVARTTVAAMPHHNAMYRRDVLTGFGGALGNLMIDESDLQAAVRGKGLELRVSRRSVSRHINEGRRWHVLHGERYIGRRFAAQRARDWSLARRLAYVAASPAIGVLHWVRTMRKASGLEDARGRLTSIAMPVGLASFAFALGEAEGYLAGNWQRDAPFETHEFHVVGRLGDQPLAPGPIASLVALMPPDVP